MKAENYYYYYFSKFKYDQEKKENYSCCLIQERTNERTMGCYIFCHDLGLGLGCERGMECGNNNILQQRFPF